MTGDRYMFFRDTRDEDVISLIAKADLSYDDIKTYDISLKDALVGGSDVTDFEKCLITVRIPEGMDTSKGTIRVFSVKDGVLDQSIESYVSAGDDGLWYISFLTTHFSPYAFVYTLMTVPATPATPTTPSTPATPSTPVTPTDPAAPTTPVAPATPAASVTPTAAVIPVINTEMPPQDTVNPRRVSDKVYTASKPTPSKEPAEAIADAPATGESGCNILWLLIILCILILIVLEMKRRHDMREQRFAADEFDKPKAASQAPMTAPPPIPPPKTDASASTKPDIADKSSGRGLD